jgi:hypothetical protein
MKQHITKEQWDEIDDKGQNLFYEFGLYDLSPSILKSSDEVYYQNQLPNIGQMIEFLGDDWIELYNDTLGRMTVEDCMDVDEMCDNLWEAVKNKLNKK